MKLESGKLHIASVAPSFPVYFDCHPLQLVTALKRIGFDIVEETVVVLPEILAMRQRCVAELSRPLISESCPQVIQLVHDHFPHLVDHLAPVPSPMELHGRTIKSQYGDPCQAIFFSPCLFKQRENEMKRAMDQVVTFDELQAVFDEQLGQPLKTLDHTPFDSQLPVRPARLGVLAMSVHGPERCSQFLSHFPAYRSGTFHEVLYCEGGCVQAARRANTTVDETIEKIMTVWETY